MRPQSRSFTPGWQGRRGLEQGTERKSRKERGIRFWAKQFYEHFQFIRDLIERNELNQSLSDDQHQELREVQKAWKTVRKNPQIPRLGRLVDVTKEIKEEMRGVVSGLNCVPDLLNHMMEELEYFERSVLLDSFTQWDEVTWWAREHAENLEYVACQLPVLIQEDDLGEQPRVVDDIVENARELADQFREIYRELGGPAEGALARAAEGALGRAAQVAEGVGETLGIIQEGDGDGDGDRDWARETESQSVDPLSESYDRSVDPDQLRRMLELKTEHMDSVSELIRNVPSLPLHEDTKKALKKMLEHEGREAEFAYQRIQESTGR